MQKNSVKNSVKIMVKNMLNFTALKTKNPSQGVLKGIFVKKN